MVERAIAKKGSSEATQGFYEDRVETRIPRKKREAYPRCSVGWMWRAVDIAHCVLLYEILYHFLAALSYMLLLS